MRSIQRFVDSRIYPAGSECRIRMQYMWCNIELITIAGGPVSRVPETMPSDHLTFVGLGMEGVSYLRRSSMLVHHLPAVLRSRLYGDPISSTHSPVDV